MQRSQLPIPVAIVAVILTASVLSTPPPASAAIIKGTVTTEGANDSMPVVVYLEGNIKGAPSKKPATPVLANKGKSFVPGIIAVQAGSAIDVVNEDDIFHNAYSLSKDNPFDIGLQKRGDKKELLLKTPGRVDVFCAIHPEMHGLILVLDNPFYATVDKHGRYSIDGVPPGKYTVKARHATLGEQNQQVVLNTNEAKADFIFAKKSAK